MNVIHDKKCERLTTPSSEIPEHRRGGKHFNKCEHLFVELHPHENQTISVELPNGQFVTLCFVASSNKATQDFECMDIHFSGGKKFFPKDRDYPLHKQVVVGFTTGHNTFDTRKITEPTTLTTLLLSPAHNV